MRLVAVDQTPRAGVLAFPSPQGSRKALHGAGPCSPRGQAMTVKKIRPFVEFVVTVMLTIGAPLFWILLLW